MPRRPRPTRFEPDQTTTAPPLPKRRGRRLGRLLVDIVLLSILVVLGVTVAYRFIPPPVTLLMIQRAGEDGIRKDWRPLERIDADLVHAVVAAEDSRFCSHNGFDVEAIKKAMEANENSTKVRGGSTITQQTAKNVFLWPQRSWLRKGLEAGFTGLIEVVWGKPRIMEVYLNVVEWAPGVYGAEAAAQRWFGKSAASLTRTEAARLAAILPAPRRYKAAPPGPYVRRRSGRIARAIQVVRDDGLSSCAFDGIRRTDGGTETPEPPRRRAPANQDVLDAARNPDTESEAPVGAPPPPPDPELPAGLPPEDPAPELPPEAVEPEPGPELAPPEVEPAPDLPTDPA
ncbi:MAG: monofunctional biosynthetic peptidoglycan transglycosylase [Proteobacteria bacterium]|nr:monofunctional biosynthetic peptidoglycan transglycosylase [Pseudomonadota bacterium]